MASLVEHTSGIYYAQFYDPARTPQRKRFSLKTRNRRTAERLLAKLDSAYLLREYNPWATPNVGDDVEPGTPSALGAAMEAYLAAHGHLRPVTLKTYREVMTPFVAHVGEDTRVSVLRVHHVAQWLETTDTKPVTRRKYVAHLGYLFRWLVARGAMAEDLSKGVALERVPESAPKAMTPEMVASFVVTAQMWPRHDYDWLADLVEANVELGLRRGELLALRPEHVDLERGVLRVVNGDGFVTKSGKERAIPVSTTACRVLRARLGSAREYVFASPSGVLTPDSMSHAFLNVRKQAGLPDWVNLHSTRHTALTRLAEKGVPVEMIRQFAGHSSITVTERYCRMRPDVVADHVRRAFG